MPRNFWSRLIRNIYIFCEWATEEKYFREINRIYRWAKVSIRKIKNLWRWGCFKNARKLNQTIYSEVEKDKVRWISVENKIYAVFDLDIFTKADIDNLSRDIDESIVLVPSNWTFEYWLLCHFESYNLANGKSEYLKRIKTFITLDNDKFTGRNDFSWLTNNKIREAAKNAKTNNCSYWNLKDRDPYSWVYNIIEYLDSIT